MKLLLTGNYAAAYGVKLSRVEVVSAYPITPQTSVIEKISEFIEKGELKARFIRVESEHSAMAAIIGAAFAGARAYTATSAQGLLYMYEMVWWAAGARLPIVMGLVTRGIAPPWSIWTDHSDFMSIRDSGWVLLFASSAQEVLDFTIMAFKLAEEVMLPVAVGWDAFIVSHTAEPVEIPKEERVVAFLGEKKRSPSSVDFENPGALGALAFPRDYPVFRENIHAALLEAGVKFREVEEAYSKIARYTPLGPLEEIHCDDADVILVLMGASVGDAVEASRRLREKGVKLGIARIRVLRPFPKEEIARLLSKANLAIVFDRSYSFGAGGVLALETRAALHEKGVKTPVVGVVGGLGGADLPPQYFEEITLKALKEVR